MKSKGVYLGFDIGASSGRAALGVLEKDRLEITEIYRFPNGPILLNGTLYWDILALWQHILESMRICRQKGISELSGIGIDTWGVDFGLIGPDGRLLRNPVCYRDRQTEGIEYYIRQKIEEQSFYQLTGFAPGRVATLSQLIALKNGLAKKLLEVAESFLMVPDLFRYFLSGHKGSEITILGSSQLLNVRTGDWCQEIFDLFEIPIGLMPPIVSLGSVAGDLLPEVCQETGIRSAPVMVIAGHDTLSAAAAVPYVNPDSVFLSSGTWSIFGIITDKPYTSVEARKIGFVNELGVDSVLFVKNMMGFYLLENLRQRWLQNGEESSYSELITAAAEAAPFSIFLDLNASTFFAPEDPESAITRFLWKTGQNVSPTRAEILRGIFEGLVFMFLQSISDLEVGLNKDIQRITIVGGGVKNPFYCQLIADATGLEVQAGPSEATMAGNIGLQALAAGQLRKSSEIRELVSGSFSLTRYFPQPVLNWEKYFDLYREVVKRGMHLER